MKFIIERSDEALFSHSGLALVGSLVKKSGLSSLIDKIDPKRSAIDVYPSSDIAKSMIGLLCMAKPDFDDIIPFRKDTYFVKALDLSQKKAPSSPTLRQRLDAASAEWDEAILESNTKLLKEQANIKASSCGYVLLSFDVSPMDNSDSHKEGVSHTYKNFDGFAPMFAHLGEAGHLINLEFRQGSAHSQHEGTPAFIRHSIRWTKQVVKHKILCLHDSGNDSVDNVKECRGENADFIIKRNLRKEKPEDWLAIAKDHGQAKIVRAGKTEYLGRLIVSVEGLDEPVDIVFRVIERTIDRKGQLLLTPEVEVETYWTSLKLEPEKIIEIYHLRGTFEQFHSEFKTDMDLERLPSGYFSTNTRMMFLGLLAYNILRIIGQSALGFDSYRRDLKKGTARRRLKSVIQDLIYLACRLVSRSNRSKVLLGRQTPFFEVFSGLYYRWA
jgi:hypothetical protein